MVNVIRRPQAMLLAGVLAIVSVATFSAAAEQQAETGLRTWTDSSGRHTVKATFLELRNDNVRLKKENGDVIQVPLNKLSEADREAAKKLMEKARAAIKSKDGGDDNPFSAPSPASEPPTVQDMVRSVGKGIVLIAARDQFGAMRALGSGFVIDRSGLVATNYHVIENASSASVRFRDGTAVEVAGYRALDKKHDLAVLQLKSLPKTSEVLTLQVSNNLKQGDAVIAIGHPAGFEFTVSNGIISAIRKTAEMPEQVQAFLKSDPECRWLQITAPSAAGSSGGPLLNARGEVIGVVAWIVPSQGMGFAVQAQHLSDLKKRLSQKVFSLPVPGSFLGPGVSDPAVLEELALLRGELQDYFTKVRSVADRERAMEIAKSENPIPGHIGNFRKLAERHPGTRLEFEVLATIVRLAHDDSPESRERCAGPMAACSARTSAPNRWAAC